MTIDYKIWGLMQDRNTMIAVWADKAEHDQQGYYHSISNPAFSTNHLHKLGFNVLVFFSLSFKSQFLIDLIPTGFCHSLNVFVFISGVLFMLLPLMPVWLLVD